MFSVYALSSETRNYIYVGMISNLQERIKFQWIREDNKPISAISFDLQRRFSRKTIGKITRKTFEIRRWQGIFAADEIKNK